MADLESTADILARAVPALSATSDAPDVVGETPAAAVSEAVTDATETTETSTEESGVETAVDTTETEVAAEPAKKPDARTTRIKSLETQTETLQGELAKALDAIKQLTAPKEPASVTVTEPPPERTPEAKPARDAYDNPDAFEEALIAWAGREAAASALHEADTRRAERERSDAEARAAESAKTEAGTRIEAWNTRRSAFIEAHPDYVAVAESDTLQINDPMAQIIATHDKGPDIAYWLGQNPQEAARIVKETPFRPIPEGASPQQANAIAARNVQSLMRAGIELGRISALVGTEAAKPAAPQVSKAPNPISPILGGSERAAEPSAEELSGDEYFDNRINAYRSQRRPSGIGRVMN